MISFHALKRSLVEALVQFLWDQWVSIGMAGAARFRPVPFAVDPEALLLATSRFGLEDARLFGEALDWLAANGRLLCGQKLKSMHLRSDLGETRVLGAMGRHLAAEGADGPLKLLMPAPDASPAPGLSEWFGESAFELRGQSLRPDPREPEAFLFKMRSFFGVNARAEVFAWLLLAGRSGHPAGIARETGWGAKTVQVVLNEMAGSGLVHLSKGEREKRFRIDPGRWQFVLPPGRRPAWWSQAPFYEACRGLLDLLGELEAMDGSSAAALSVKIREHGPGLVRAFDLAKQPGRFEGISLRRGEELVESVRKETARLVEAILDRDALLAPGFPEEQEL